MINDSNELNPHRLYNDAVDLLKSLINIPSISRNEAATADHIQKWLMDKGIHCHRWKNNVWAQNAYYDASKPTLLLLSHHDTVNPSPHYTHNPYEPFIKAQCLYGLGANDAGGPLVTFISLFRYFYAQSMAFNLVLCAAAEEEVSGVNGIESALEVMPFIDFALVGEPTSMQAAVSEKGLLVCDCTSFGQAGHAARDEGINAIYKALDDLDWLKKFDFERVSATLGSVKMTVTQIEAGRNHNVVPDQCRFVVDIRVTDVYTHKEIINTMTRHMVSHVQPRSYRLKSSSLPNNHPFKQMLDAYQVPSFGSVTMSDQALLNCPSVKFAPGESCRSHTADEFIRLKEIETGIAFFIRFFNTFIYDQTWQDQFRFINAN